MNASEIKLEHRTHLFYNQYKYKLSINSEGLRFCSSYMTPKSAYTTRVNKSYSYLRPENVAKKVENLYNSNIEILSICRLLKQRGCRLRREYDDISVFSNNLEDFEPLKKFNYKITEAIDGLSITCMYFVKFPQYTWRIYFGRNNYSDTENIREQMSAIVERYKSNVRPSKKLQMFINNTTGRWRHNNIEGCSIDFSDPKLMTLFRLVLGSYIQKTFELKQLPTDRNRGEINTE